MQPFLPPLAAAPAQPARPLPAPRDLQFRFTGTGAEYFRIWIVNVALTILTLGVYSAWAKVRTKQYFYRHMWLEDSTFEYLASPIPILKGRIIIAVALGLLYLSQIYSLAIYLGLVFVMVLLTPLVVQRALAFNARNSAYKNVRFSFTGNAGATFGIYIQMMLVYALTCGIGYPYAQWKLTQFVVSRHLYGDERFLWNVEVGAYFRVFLIALVMVLGVYALAFASVFGAGAALKPSGAGGMETAFLVLVLAVYALLLLPVAYTRARIANLVYGGTRIGPHKLLSNQRARDLLKLYATNALAVVASLGLLMPWAKIRLARYRAEHLQLQAVGPLHAENYELAGKPGAIGDAATDLGDFDFDIGL